MLILVKHVLEKIINFVGLLASLSVLVLLLTICYNVIMRRFFNDVDIGYQEFQWHVFSCMFLFGIGYSLKENAHVRVDVIYEKLGVKAQAWINLLGTFILLVPISLLIIEYGYDFAKEAYDSNERSGDPGGLSHRWIIKAAIPASFAFTLLCAMYVVIEQILIIRQKDSSTNSEVSS